MKAEDLCSKYIENIKKDQGLQLGDKKDNKETRDIDNTWKEISSSDLFKDKRNSPEKAWLVWYGIQEKLEILKSRINERAKSSVAETKDQMLQNLDEHLHKIDRDDSTSQAGGYSSCERMETASGAGNSGAESLSQADEPDEKTPLLRKSKKKTRHEDNCDFEND